MSHGAATTSGGGGWSTSRLDDDGNKQTACVFGDLESALGFEMD
jgi:hypothetical protein